MLDIWVVSGLGTQAKAASQLFLFPSLSLSPTCASILFLHLGISRTMAAEQMQWEAVDKTDSDPVPPAKLLPLTALTLAMKKARNSSRSC
jgi:hypothetical protein